MDFVFLHAGLGRLGGPTEVTEELAEALNEEAKEDERDGAGGDRLMTKDGADAGDDAEDENDRDGGGAESVEQTPREGPAEGAVVGDEEAGEKSFVDPVAGWGDVDMIKAGGRFEVGPVAGAFETKLEFIAVRESRAEAVPEGEEGGAVESGVVNGEMGDFASGEGGRPAAIVRKEPGPTAGGAGVGVAHAGRGAGIAAGTRGEEEGDEIGVGVGVGFSDEDGGRRGGGDADSAGGAEVGNGMFEKDQCAEFGLVGEEVQDRFARGGDEDDFDCGWHRLTAQAIDDGPHGGVGVGDEEVGKFDHDRERERRTIMPTCSSGMSRERRREESSYCSSSAWRQERGRGSAAQAVRLKY